MSIVKKIKTLHKKFEGLGLLQTYQAMMRDENYRLLLKRMKPIDIVKFVFGVYAFNQKEDVEEVLYKIESGLFAFSIVAFQDEPAEITCDNCRGNGYVRCDECDGVGYVGCDNCDEDGLIWDGESEENITCTECNGRGHFRCDNCAGNGSYECDSCDGNGYVYDKNYTDFSILAYLCYDESILFKLQKAFETNSPLSIEFESSLNKKCIRIAYEEVFAKDNSKLTFRIDEKYKDDTFVNDIKEILDYDLVINDRKDKGSILSVKNLDKLYREKFQE